MKGFIKLPDTMAAVTKNAVNTFYSVIYFSEFFLMNVNWDEGDPNINI